MRCREATKLTGPDQHVRPLAMVTRQEFASCRDRRMCVEENCVREKLRRYVR
jgi:hypothetical protein